MPELPEVESIKLQLCKFIVGHKIEDVDVRYKKCFTGNTDDIIGGIIKDVRRFGKALVIDLSNGFSMVVHIKMTGQFIYRGPNLKDPPDISDKVKGGINGKHTHVVFELNHGGVLYYNDYRKFGWIKVVKTSEVNDVDFIKKLGPEFLDSLTEEKFKELAGSTSRAIKILLMDQSKVAGVGNIYANDALFLAEIDPRRKANSLSDEEIKRLYESVEEVLKRGIKAGGASEIAFVTPDGTDGDYQSGSLVYGKEGKTCPRCAEKKIKKIKLGGRGTYFCPSCQH